MYIYILIYIYIYIKERTQTYIQKKNYNKILKTAVKDIINKVLKILFNGKDIVYYSLLADGTMKIEKIAVISGEIKA